MSRPSNGIYGQWAGDRKGRPRDPNRCEESIYDKFAPGGRQCDRKWAAEKPDGSQWCKQHDPDAAKARLEASDRRYREQSARELEARWLGVVGKELLEALRELVARCDGEEGVRADGSNIQTMRAHAAIAKAEGR